MLWDEYWKDDPRSQISKVIDRLDGNVPDTIECDRKRFVLGRQPGRAEPHSTNGCQTLHLLEAYKVTTVAALTIWQINSVCC